MVSADVSMFSCCFVVPRKPTRVPADELHVQALIHTVMLGSAALGSNVANPYKLPNSNARTDNMGPIVEFGPFRRISCASSWSLDLVSVPHGVTKPPVMPGAGFVTIDCEWNLITRSEKSFTVHAKNFLTKCGVRRKLPGFLPAVVLSALGDVIDCPFSLTMKCLSLCNSIRSQLSWIARLIARCQSTQC